MAGKPKVQSRKTLVMAALVAAAIIVGIVIYERRKAQASVNAAVNTALDNTAASDTLPDPSTYYDESSGLAGSGVNAGSNGPTTTTPASPSSAPATPAANPTGGGVNRGTHAAVGGGRFA